MTEDGKREGAGLTKIERHNAINAATEAYCAANQITHPTEDPYVKYLIGLQCAVLRGRGEELPPIQ